MVKKNGNGTIKIGKWLELWDAVQKAYSRYTEPVKQMANVGPMRFRVCNLGLSFQRLSAKLHSRGDIKGFLSKMRKLGWEGVTADGPKNMFQSAHADANMDFLGAISHVFLLTGAPDWRTFLMATWVLQYSQKEVLSRFSDCAQDFEYFLSRVSREFGWYPRLIVVGDQWKPLLHMIDAFAEAGCIRKGDRKLICHVPDMAAAQVEIAKDAEAFERFCQEHEIKTENRPWDKSEHDELRTLRNAARKAYDGEFLPALEAWSKVQERRERVAGYGSHLALAGNDEAVKFGAWLFRTGRDLTAGGGPTEMENMAVGMGQERETNGTVQMITALDDMLLLEGPKIFGCMLRLPGEQSIPSSVDVRFANNHFWPRLAAFWGISFVHVAKSMGGFGTLFEIAASLYRASKIVQQKNLSKHRRRFRDVGFYNPLCRRMWVPRTICIGPLWEGVEALITHMLAAGSISKRAAKNFVLVSSLEAAQEQIEHESGRLAALCRRNSIPLVRPKY